MKLSQKTTLSFKHEDDFIVTIGMLNGSVGGSEYLKTIHNKIEGPIAKIDIDLEIKVQSVCLEAIKSGIINSAHDISDGGLAVNLAESISFSKPGLGADISIDRKLRTDQILFGESQGVIIVSLDSKNLHHVALLAQKYNIYTQTLGTVTETAKLKINESINLSRKKIEKAYFNSLSKIMS